MEDREDRASWRCRSKYLEIRELSTCWAEDFYRTCGRNQGESWAGSHPISPILIVTMNGLYSSG